VPFGVVRRPSTRYALLLFDTLLDTHGAPLSRTPTEPALANRIAAAGQDPSSVRVAVPFTTGDATARLQQIAAWYRDQPAPVLDGPLVLDQVFDTYVTFHGRLRVPTLQPGNRPWLSEGDGGVISIGPDGAPRIEGHESARFVVSVPRQPMPAAGYASLVYLHGTGGQFDQVVTRQRLGDPSPPDGPGPARTAAARGAAAYGYDQHLHGDRMDPPESTGLIRINHPLAAVDSFIVAASELNLHIRALHALEIEPAAADGALDMLEGPIRFDPEGTVVMTQSMGSTIGVPAATVDDRARGLIISGGGGLLIETFTTATRPLDWAPIVRAAQGLGADEPLDAFDPMTNALQMVWDIVDPVTHARHLHLEPHPGLPAKHVLQQQGLRDGYFSEASRGAIAAAAGLDALAPVLEPPLADRLGYVEGAVLDTDEITRNRPPQTAIVTQYDAVEGADGHTVSFDRADARAQWGCFLESAGQAVRRGDSASEPCPPE
jgi:hypothetical protein